MNEEKITISLEEYKELLTIKGKYEELSKLSLPHIYPTQITYNGETIKKYQDITPKITWANYTNENSLGDK